MDLTLEPHLVAGAEVVLEEEGDGVVAVDLSRATVIGTALVQGKSDLPHTNPAPVSSHIVKI